MSVIIRLQNLPWNANALDIRRFFQGLSVPDGGVHIIGGDKGDAFIAFSTDEDARQAMMKDGGHINGYIIKLFLSSKTEMQNVISTAKNVYVAAKDVPPPAMPPPVPVMGAPKPGGFYDRPGIPPVGGTTVLFAGASDGRGDVTGSGQGLRSSTGFSTLPPVVYPGSNSQPVVYPGSNSQMIPPLQLQPAGTLMQVNEPPRNMPAAPVMLQPVPARSIFDTRPTDRPPMPVNLQQPPAAPMDPMVPRLPPAVPGIQPVGAWTTPQPPPVNREPPPPDFGRAADIPSAQPVRFDGYSYNAGTGREPVRMDVVQPDPNYPRTGGPTGPVYGAPESGRSFVQVVEPGRNPSGPPPDVNRGNFGRPENNMPFGRAEEQRDRGRFVEDPPTWPKRGAGRPEGGSGSGQGWAGVDRPFGGRDDSRRDFVQPNVDQGMHAPDRWFDNRNMRPDQGGPKVPDYGPRGPDQGPRGPDYGQRGPNQGPIGPDYGPRGPDLGHRAPDYGPRGPDLGPKGPDHGPRGPDYGPRDFVTNELPPPRLAVVKPNDGYGPGRPSRFPEGSASRFGPNAGSDNKYRDDSRPGFMPPEPRLREPPRSLMDEPLRRPPLRFEGRPPSPPRGRFQGDGFPPREDPWRNQRQDFDPRQMKGTRDLCVHVTNLPTSFNYREVRRTFQGCRIPRDGVKLINDRNGMRTGVVFQLLQDAKSLHMALGLNGKMIGDRRITVERCTDADFDMAVDSAVPKATDRSRSPRPRHPQGNPNISHFVLKKLPKKTEKEDIRKFFGKLQIAPDGGPFFELTYDKTRTGNALVAVEEEEFGKVLKLHHNMLNGAAIDVIKINEYEFEERSRRCRQMERDVAKDAGQSKPLASVAPSVSARDKKVEKQESGRSGNGESDGRQPNTSDTEPRSCFIEMRGVPYTAAPPLIQDFFREVNIPTENIHIVYNREHRATGIAFVEFASPDDQQVALAKNKQHMGHRVVEIRSMSKLAMEQEYNKQVMKFGGTPLLAEYTARSNPERAKQAEGLLSMQNLHFDTELEDILEFFTGHHPVLNSIKLQYRDQQPTGDGLIAFPSMQEAEAALRSKNRHLLLGKPVTLSWAKK